MPTHDRLSALMSRFELSVRSCDLPEANFLILGSNNSPERLLLATRDADLNLQIAQKACLLCARVDWGGAQNPLLAALPIVIEQPLNEAPEQRAVVELLLTEQRASRCGAASVLNRLGEIMIVQLMRRQIAAGAMRTGLLGGLADPRLSRAIVAMHDKPGQPWRIETLAEIAGLSSSHFASLFREAVGMTPLAYLRKWRLILARQDIERGDRVQSVANRYCYGSIEALSRAFSAAYGVSPTQLRKAENAS